MMKRIHIILLLFLLIIVSCKKSPIEGDIEEFTNSHIELMLDSMMGADENTILDMHKPYLYVSYIDSTSCTSCQLAHFSDWNVLEHSVDTSKLDHIFIVAPKRDERHRIIEKLTTDNIFKDKTYIDTSGVFERNNKCLPNNKLLHTFLLDKEHNVILIGSPVNNKKVKELLSKILK